MKIAVATIGNDGLQDVISPEFGHSRTFTLIDIQDGKIMNIEVLENPAKKIRHGRGPLVAKRLADIGVNMVISGELGPGASVVLDQAGIKKLIVKPGQKVEDVLRSNKLIS
ncbi:MAG: NifB/NifX family molybdenum-iron cluster-binding protein [Nitrososphaerota archaeon]